MGPLHSMTSHQLKVQGSICHSFCIEALPAHSCLQTLPDGLVMLRGSYQTPVPITNYPATNTRLAQWVCIFAGRILDLLWSPDSNLLAVHYQQGNKTSGQLLEIWLRSNWRWHLKQSLKVEASSRAAVKWAEEGPNSLTICTEKGDTRKAKSHLQPKMTC